MQNLYKINTKTRAVYIYSVYRRTNILVSLCTKMALGKTSFLRAQSIKLHCIIGADWVLNYRRSNNVRLYSIG